MSDYCNCFLTNAVEDHCCVICGKPAQSEQALEPGEKRDVYQWLLDLHVAEIGTIIVICLMLWIVHMAVHHHG